MASALGIVAAAASGNIKLGSLCACCRATVNKGVASGSRVCLIVQPPGAMLQPPVRATVTPPPTTFSEILSGDAGRSAAEKKWIPLYQISYQVHDVVLLC